MNLSKYTLNKDETDLLDLGLSFIPTVSKMNIEQIEESQNKLIRSIKLRDFFGDDDQPYVKNDRMFTDPSTWVPEDEDLSPAAEQLIARIQETTETILHDYPIKNNAYYFRNKQENITRTQRRCITSLSKNKDIIIKPADKGGMVCVLNKKSYITEAERQLNDTKYYSPIETPLKEQTIPKINNVLERLLEENYIDNMQFNYLSAKSTDNDRKFYLLPKIHKPKDKWTLPDMPQGRPIVGDCGTESRRISDYIDSFLKPMANKHPTYIKDTYDFIKKIKNRKINNNHILVTGDITSLYTNMNIERTILKVKEFFSRYPDRKRPDKELLELLEIAMKNNDFSFCNKFFLQIFGTAMGKSFAPNLANIYLIDFDKQACNDFYIKPIDFYRFLDDIFFLWPGTIEQLKEFENFLNSLIPDIKITLTYDHSAISFLDTTVFKHTENGITSLQTKVFFKETDTHQLLHHSSFHPKHTFTGILKSQLLRFKRLSSFKSDYDQSCNILFHSLKQRGYAHRLLRQGKRSMWYDYEQRNARMNKQILPIIIPYNPLSAKLVYEWKQIILEQQKFRNCRIIGAFYRNRNLAQLLAPRQPRSAINKDKQLGSMKCNSDGCSTCKHINVTNKITSTYTRRQHNITRPLSCNSKNVIYLITCNLCNKQYVNVTRMKISEAFTDYTCEITNHANTPISNHFNSPGHSINNISITLIEQVTAAELSNFRHNPTLLENKLLLMASCWRQLLVTYEPYGINLRRKI